MPKNPIQRPAKTPGDWFFSVVGPVLWAQATGEAMLDAATTDGPDSAVLAHWPDWLVRKVRRAVVGAGKDWALYVMGAQAKRIEDLNRRADAADDYAALCLEHLTRQRDAAARMARVVEAQKSRILDLETIAAERGEMLRAQAAEVERARGKAAEYDRLRDDYDSLKRLLHDLNPKKGDQNGTP